MTESAEEVGRWVCHIDAFDPEYHELCPRCGKPCTWGCSITVWPSGPIRQGTIHWPMCPCPDDHIRKALAQILAEILVKDFRERATPPEGR